MLFPTLMRPATILSFALLGAACATPVTDPPAAGGGAPAQSAEKPAYDPERAEEIMNQPLDGSSVEAFRKDLAEVKQTVSPAAYRQLESALSWLLFYDVSSRGDPERLYRMLDGKTPRQIISRAHWEGG